MEGGIPGDKLDPPPRVDDTKADDCEGETKVGRGVGDGPVVTEVLAEGDDGGKVLSMVN